jgi:hypothetical protein
MTNDQIPDHIKDVPDTIVNEIIECASRTEIGTGPFFANEKNGPVPISTACTTAFKIIKPELEFYRRMNLPLPRYCPNCRHYQRLQQRNPLKLWRRTCQCAGAKSSNGVYQNTIAHFHQDQPCSNEFETSYAPDRPEIVYCEKCYLKEVV